MSDDAPASAAMRWVARGWLVVIVAVYGVAGLDASIRGRAYAALSLVASGFMLAAWGAAERTAHTRLLLRTGVLARLFLLFVPAFTSNDAVRYLWDGAATLAGFDPYFYSPRGIASLVPGWTPPTDNAGYVTLYPPGALSLFVVAASFGPVFGPFVWKALATAASIGTLLVGERALVLASRERHLAWLAFSPLLVLETGVGAHVDAFASLSVALAMHAWLARKPLGAAAWLATGALVKLTPLIALAPLLVAAERRVRLAMLGVALVVVALAYRAAFRVGLRPLGSLGEFLTDWRFGSPLFAAMEHGLGTRLALGVGAIAGGSLVLGACVWARRSAGGNEPATPGAARLAGPIALALVAPFVASPVTFPWYLVASVPVVALRPSFTWLAWASTLPLTYEALDHFRAGASFMPDPRVLVVISLAVVLGLAVDVRRVLLARAFASAS